MSNNGIPLNRLMREFTTDNVDAAESDHDEFEDAISRKHDAAIPTQHNKFDPFSPQPTRPTAAHQLRAPPRAVVVPAAAAAAVGNRPQQPAVQKPAAAAVAVAQNPRATVGVKKQESPKPAAKTPGDKKAAKEKVAKKETTPRTLKPSSQRSGKSRVKHGKAGVLLDFAPSDSDEEDPVSIEIQENGPDVGEAAKLSTVENRAALEGAVTSVLTYKVVNGVKGNFKWERCCIEEVDTKTKLVTVRAVDKKTGDKIPNLRFINLNKCQAQVPIDFIRVQVPVAL